ncbi:HD domain-containing protein, partial [Candidatus Woesebacteria bacterium]|nr:HD domain-containing protein [Candidatus Woesebacteria bacterium]
MNNKATTNLIYEAANVKRMLRTGWQRLGDNEEGVGEHSFMTAVIAYLLAREINLQGKADRTVSMEKVMLMSIFHDFHEGRTGEMDKVAKLYMTRHEDKANEDIFGEVDKELLALLTEYEAKQSLEALVVYEANVIAFGVECKILMERGNTHAKEWMDANSTRVRLPESVALMTSLAQTDSQDWWKDIREQIHEEFA